MSITTSQMPHPPVDLTSTSPSVSPHCADLDPPSPAASDIFSAYPATRKKGSESFTSNGQPLETKLIDFWRWSVSDLVSNATRGRLAEFIVASALDITDGVRNEWDAFDLEMLSGLKSK